MGQEGRGKGEIRGFLRSAGKLSKQRARHRTTRRRVLAAKVSLRAQLEQLRKRDNAKGKISAVRIGTWNTRGMGATEGQIDPALKMEALLSMWDARGWGAVLLSDLQYGKDGIYEYRSKENVWTVVVSGRVGIALNRYWTYLSLASDRSGPLGLS